MDADPKNCFVEDILLEYLGDFQPFSLTVQDLQEEVPFCVPVQVVLHLQQLLLSALPQSFLEFLSFNQMFVPVLRIHTDLDADPYPAF